MKADIETIRKMHKKVSAGIPKLEAEITELKSIIAEQKEIDPSCPVLKIWYRDLKSARFLLKTDKHIINTCESIFRGHDKGLVLKWVRPA